MLRFFQLFSGLKHTLSIHTLTLVSPSWNDSDVTSHQTTDLQCERVSDWQKEKERKRREQKVSVGKEWAGPRRWSDSDMLSRPRAALVSHSASYCGDEHRRWLTARHNQSQSTSFGSVTLHGPPAVTHSFILPVSLRASHSVVLQNQLSFESVLICLFVRKITKQQPTNELVSQWCKTRFPLEKKITTCKARKLKDCIYSSSTTFPKCWKRIKNCYHLIIYMYCNSY